MTRNVTDTIYGVQQDFISSIYDAVDSGNVGTRGLRKQLADNGVAWVTMFVTELMIRLRDDNDNSTKGS